LLLVFYICKENNYLTESVNFGLVKKSVHFFLNRSKSRETSERPLFWTFFSKFRQNLNVLVVTHWFKAIFKVIFRDITNGRMRRSIF
jgi:hypothetical protein